MQELFLETTSGSSPPDFLMWFKTQSSHLQLLCESKKKWQSFVFLPHSKSYGVQNHISKSASRSEEAEASSGDVLFG